MKTLLIIHSYAGGEPQLKWNWPQFQLTGWDILGVTPTNASHSWPAGVKSVQIAENGYAGTQELVKRFVGTFQHVLKPEFSVYSDFCLIEYDGFFLRKPPPHPGGLVTHLAGGNIPSVKATRFFHTPWWPDRAVAQTIVSEGLKMMAEGEWEFGSPDFFLGRLLDRTGLPYHQSHTWSVNRGNFAQRKDQAIRPIKDGIWYLHGTCTKEEMDWCLNLRPDL